MSNVPHSHQAAFTVVAKFKADYLDSMRARGIPEPAVRWMWWRFEAMNFALLTCFARRRVAREVIWATLHAELILSDN